MKQAFSISTTIEHTPVRIPPQLWRVALRTPVELFMIILRHSSIIFAPGVRTCTPVPFRIYFPASELAMYSRTRHWATIVNAEEFNTSFWFAIIRYSVCLCWFSERRCRRVVRDGCGESNESSLGGGEFSNFASASRDFPIIKSARDDLTIGS